jgi:RNA polymerase sigma-70 factor, ECF subfamily
MDATDEELVREVLRGDRRAFDLWMQRYERLVYRIVQNFCGNREDALDLTQTVFLKAYRGLSGFRADASSKTWLLRIAHNEGVEWSRLAGRRPASADTAAIQELAEPPTQESAVLALERRRQLALGLNSLAARPRTALILRYLHRRPIREIAGVLNVSETRTKNILFRGVRSLRKAVAEGAWEAAS